MRLFRERGGLRPRAAAPGIIAIIPANTGLVRWNGGTTTPVHHGRRGRPAAAPGTMMQTGKKMGSERIDWRRLLLALPLAAALGACSTLPEAARAPAAVAPAEAATATAHVQQRRDWHFAADGVAFSNRLEGARLNDVQRLGSDHYVVTIAPEIVPINPSPWYGFTVSAETERPLRIEFRYRDGKARYWPKLSRDGEHWHAATPEQFAEGGQGTTLTVDAGPQPLHVFAQPPIGIEAFADWANVLVERGITRRSGS